LQRLIAELRDTRPQLVLVHKLDRFARNRYDSAIYRRELQKVGARLIAVDQPIDDSPEGVILEALLEGMAEYYSKNLAREVMKGMTENAYEAKFNGGWVPLGYDITPNKQYVINEHEADTIRLIFSTKLAGMSYGAIADKLNILGRKTKRGRPFGKNSIYEILRNEKYCGTYVFNETPKRVAGKRNNRIKNTAEEIIRIENAIPAIVSKADWLAVNEMLDSNKAGPRNIDKSSYILTGVLRCGECGSAITGFTVTKKGKNEERIRYRYYTCHMGRKRNGECSHSKKHPADELETQVLDTIEREILNPDDINVLADKLWEEIQVVNSSQDTENIELKKRLAEIEKKMDRITQAILQGLDMKHMVGTFNELGQQKEQVLKRLNQRRSPFESMTRQEVISFLKSQQEFNRNNLEDCKRIIAANVKTAILSVDGFDIMLKYQFGLSVDGVGGGT
jgi:site-specific DNA recombinase